MAELITAAAGGSWPAAFALVGIFAAACGFGAVAMWALTKI